MTTPKAVLVVGWVIAVVLWVAAATVWKGRTIEKLRPGSPAWFWLHTFGIPETKQNREKAIVWISVFGIAISTVCVVVVLIFGNK
jgi:hypothetical protein